MNKFIILISTVFFLANSASAQLFKEQEFYPNIKNIKQKFFGGTGGGGFWSLKKLDSIGRIVEIENFREDRFLGKTRFVYNSHNDKLHEIKFVDFNKPNQKNDTIFSYEYKYQNDRIVYQKQTFNRSKQDSIITILIDVEGDTSFTYQRKRYLFRARTNVTDIYEEKHILTYRNGQLVRIEVFDFNNHDRENTYFEYYPDGKLKRRKIERDPDMEGGVYVGGIGSDDMSYKYKFDKLGRVTKLYYIVNRKKYLIATYQYLEE